MTTGRSEHVGVRRGDGTTPHRAARSSRLGRAAYRAALAGAFGAVAILVTGASFEAVAQPRCVFLECGPDNRANPSPPQAPAVPQAQPVPAAIAPLRPSREQSRHSARPSVPGETCAAVISRNHCVSSVLKPQFGNTYGPGNLFDGDLTTAWVEGKPGHGEGEWVVVTLGARGRVNGLQIMNGYHKNERLFKANSRLRLARLTFSSGRSRQIELDDAPGIQTFEFEPEEADWVQLTILSVYPGSRYTDTAVTELRVLVEP